jgi:hypothetical protein
MLKTKSTGEQFVEALLDHCPGRGAYSSAFLAALDSGGAWSAEACRVIAIAAQQHVVLDERLLTLSDVRDLQRYLSELTSRLHSSEAA